MFDFIYWLASYVVPFLAVLTVIVFVHEMGHYLVARWNGIAIQTFSVGFGREVFGWNDKAGTRWRLSAIPLGGYVRFVGDMDAASTPDREAIANADPALASKLFANKNVWQRIAVVIAGPVANVILTFVLLYALLLGYGRYTIPPGWSPVTSSCRWMAMPFADSKTFSAWLPPARSGRSAWRLIGQARARRLCWFQRRPRCSINLATSSGSVESG